MLGLASRSTTHPAVFPPAAQGEHNDAQQRNRREQKRQKVMHRMSDRVVLMCCEEPVECGKSRGQCEQILSRQFESALIGMIGGALGVAAAGQVTFDVAPKDMRDRTRRQKFNRARRSSCPPRCPQLSTGPAAEDRLRKRARFSHHRKRCEPLHARGSG